MYLHSNLSFKPTLVFGPCVCHLSFKTAALSSNWLWWDWPFVTNVPMFLFFMTQPRPKLWVMSSGHRADGAKAGKSQREWNNAHSEWCTEGSWTGEDPPTVRDAWAMRKVWLRVQAGNAWVGKGIQAIHFGIFPHHKWFALAVLLCLGIRIAREMIISLLYEITKWHRHPVVKPENLYCSAAASDVLGKCPGEPRTMTCSPNSLPVQFHQSE